MPIPRLTITDLTSGTERCRTGRWRIPRKRAIARAFGLSLGLSLGLGCGSENLKPDALPDQADLFWDLRLNHHAVLMSTTAPYDTLPLVATPLNFRGEPLAVALPVTYRSTDPEHVLVRNDGVLVALSRTPQPVEVVATLTFQNIRRTDTVLVTAVDDSAPPTLAGFSIHPVPPDSAKVGVSVGSGAAQPRDTLRPRAVTVGGTLLPVYALDSAGYLPVYFRSSDTTVALIGRNLPEIDGRRVGSFTISASTTAFGVRMVDTLPYRIGLPIFGQVNVFLAYSNPDIPSYKVDKNFLQWPELWIGAGGAVMWDYAGYLPGSPDSLDITFADADVPNIVAVRPLYDLLQSTYPSLPFWFCAYDCDSGGNLMLSTSQWRLPRRFPVPGTYEYHSARFGVSGRIVVVDER